VDYEHVSDAVMPVLHQLVAVTSETVHYAVYEDGYAVYVEKVDGLHPIRAYSSVGGRSPAYASATGKALLAWQTGDEIARVAATTMQLTPATHVGLVALEREMAHVRSSGHAVNRGEWREGVWGIGAPVFGRSGEVIAAVGISGPEDRIAANLDVFISAVRDANRELSAQHGSFEKTA
jgi:DNA-binding IclR family transcriptional regulator